MPSKVMPAAGSRRAHDEVLAVLRGLRLQAGALAQLVPGFVVGTRLEEGARIVAFGNGAVVRELLVDIDEESDASLGRPPAGR